MRSCSGVAASTPRPQLRALGGKKKKKRMKKNMFNLRPSSCEQFKLRNNVCSDFKEVIPKPSESHGDKKVDFKRRYKHKEKVNEEPLVVSVDFVLTCMLANEVN